MNPASTDGKNPPKATPDAEKPLIFLRVDDEIVGPYVLEQLQARLQAGSLAGETPCWHEGMGEWVPVLKLIRAAAARPPVRPIMAGGVLDEGLEKELRERAKRQNRILLIAAAIVTALFLCWYFDPFSK